VHDWATTLLPSNSNRAASLLKGLLKSGGIESDDWALLIVQHVLPNTLPLIFALKESFTICGVIPKPRSVHQASLERLEQEQIPILWIKREQLDGDRICEQLNESLGNRKLILLDVGGYFAGCLSALKQNLGTRLVGVVEDTENGQQKYESAAAKAGGGFPCPVLSVARSPLKEPEDFLVGQSIVYSVERVLRENDSLLTNKRVLVIGYGKIGKSIASSLSVRNISVWVYDQDPVRRAQALSQGFLTPERDAAIAKADLIFGATGNKSLREADFLGLNAYAFVASVTSADDEFEFGALREKLLSHESHDVETFFNEGRIFHLINKGNAVNFTWNNQTLGPYIYLVACEIAASVIKLIRERDTLGLEQIHTLSTDERRQIASQWHETFGNIRL